MNMVTIEFYEFRALHDKRLYAYLGRRFCFVFADEDGSFVEGSEQKMIDTLLNDPKRNDSKEGMPEMMGFHRHWTREVEG